MIEKYENEAAWNSAEKTENTLGLIQNTGEIKTKGFNIITKSPKVGDAIYLDSNNDIRAIELDSLTPSLLSGWTSVGSVYHTEGDNIWIVAKNGGAYKWAAVAIWRVTGYTLDGTSRTGVWRSYQAASTTTDNTFTYSATTKEDFTSQLHTFISAIDSSIYNYSAYVNTDGEVVIQANIYNSYWQNYPSFVSGLSSAIFYNNPNPTITWSPTMDGFHIIYSTCNKERIKQWGGRNAPTSEVPCPNNTPISKASFEANSNYVSRYGDYETYLDQNQPRCPSGCGAVSYRDKGKEYTNALIGKTYIDTSGTTRPFYSAAEYAVGYGFSGNTKLSAGKWWVPDLEELVYMMRDTTYGLSGVSAANADPVNRCLNLMGGSLISVTAYRWSSVRCSSYDCWNYNSYGCLDDVNFNYSFMVSPVSRLLKSDLD